MEKYFTSQLSSRFIPITLSVWILSLTAYYCINAPWLSFYSWRPDTKELVAEALEFHWVPVFLSRLPYVFYALILNFIALLMGNRILRWLRVDFDSLLNKIIFSIPLGWSIYSIGVFYLGISGLLYKEAVYLFLTLLGILSILEIKRFLREGKALTTPLKFKIDKTDLVFLPVIVIFITVQFVTSFSPVVSADPLIYHMALPKLYIKHHALVHIPGFLFSTLPAHTEMLYLLGLITSGETLSKLFSFSISSLFLISIFSIGKKYFSKGVGYLATVIMITIQFPFPFSSCFSEPWIDVAFGLFSLLGLYAFLMWIEEKREGFLYLSIIFCAFAAATKIQGQFFVLLFFVGFLLTVKMDVQFLKRLAWSILPPCIIALPWYVRSWWLTGDPVFPFLYKYLGSRHWNDYSNECLWTFLSQTQWSGVRSLSDFIRINKDLLFSTYSLSPIIGIFLIPALMTLRNGNKLIKCTFSITIAYYIFFIFTSPQMRFFYVCFAILSIVVAYFIETVWTRYLLTRIPVLLCLVILSVASFAVSGKWIVGPFFAGLGVLDKMQFFNNHRQCMVAVWVNENLPENSKILSWRLDVAYHFNRDYIMVNPAFQIDLDMSRIDDTSAFLMHIKELGITHLVYDCDHDDVFTHRVKEFLKNCITDMLESGDITLTKQIENCSIFTLKK